MFQEIPLNITGPTYQSRSRPLASQETLNMYQEYNEGGQDQYVLMPWPGQKLQSTVTGADRGLTKMSGVLYRVAGQKLYKGTTELGDILGNERCIFANDGTNLFICSNNKVYWYDGSTVTQVTDPEIDGAKSVDYINNQFIYTKDRFTTVSEVGDGSSASGLDIIGAESSPDNLVRDYVFNETILRFGTDTVERWYNSGQGQPPIARLSGQTQQIGLAAKHSIAKTDNHYYFLGDDRRVYQGVDSVAQSITPIGIANLLEGLGTVSDAIGFTVPLQGQNFYILQFPTEGLTLAINETLGANGWFTLGDGVSGAMYNVTSALYLNGVIYGADQSNGNLYKLDINTFTHNGNNVLRRRVTQTVNGSIFNKRGELLQMQRLEIIAEMGVGLITGTELPKIRIESSIDGGKSFKHEKWVSLGRLGSTQVRAEWHSNKTFREIMFRFSITDPVPVYLRTAVLEARYAGR